MVVEALIAFITGTDQDRVHLLELDILQLWEDWILRNLQTNVHSPSARPSNTHADSVGSFVSQEERRLEETAHPLGADIVKSLDLSSDISSEESDEETGLKSHLARNQNQISSAHAYPWPTHASKSISDGRTTGSNPLGEHSERMNVREELYSHSLLAIKGRVGPWVSAEDIDRIGMAVKKTKFEDLKVSIFEMDFENEFKEPLHIAIERSPSTVEALYTWFCGEVFICRNLAILVYSNLKRLQNSNLAGKYISLVVSRKYVSDSPLPRVANLNRLNCNRVLELVLAFAVGFDALRKRHRPLRHWSVRFPWDSLEVIDRKCRRLVRETESDWDDRTDTVLDDLRHDEAGLRYDDRKLLKRAAELFSMLIEYWRIVLGTVDLAILAYEGAHTTNFIQEILGHDRETIIELSNQAPSQTGLLLQRRRMKCLAELFENRDVWVFGWFASQDLQSFYLSADVVTFADVWGPVWKVLDKTRNSRVAKYNVRGGSLVPWPYRSNIHPNLGPHERLCHWRSNAASVRFEKAGSAGTSGIPSSECRSIPKKADSFAGSLSSFSDPDEEGETGSDLECFGDNTRLMIGADATPRMQWKTCHCRIDDHVQHLKDAGRLDYIIASRSYRYVDSQQTSLVIGSHGVQAGLAKTIKDKREQNLKISLLDRWENEPPSRDPHEFENLWGVVVSLCTMNARRVRLVELLGDESVVALLRNFPWSDLGPDGSTSQLRDQYLEAVRSANPHALGALWDTHVQWREELGSAILTCLKILVLTGFNEDRGEFYMLWLPSGCRGPRRITLKDTDQTWVKFLRDTTYSITTAVAVEDCLITKSRKRRCRYSRPNWFQSPSLLETAICIKNALEPAPKLVKVPGSHDNSQTDVREWRSIWDVSALDVGENFWIGSQTRVRVAAAPTNWHLIVEIDRVKRLILREILGMKASERTGHWEYTDAEAEAIDVRPIPVQITS